MGWTRYFLSLNLTFSRRVHPLSNPLFSPRLYCQVSSVLHLSLPPFWSLLSPGSSPLPVLEAGRRAFHTPSNCLPSFASAQCNASSYHHLAYGRDLMPGYQYQYYWTQGSGGGRIFPNGLILKELIGVLLLCKKTRNKALPILCNIQCKNCENKINSFNCQCV